ncbi:MAG: Hydrogenase expression/formation protein HypE [Syntrophorhabdus sp. PtaU1.Bin002]|nr:MAG: Hydrogenase expression/formation protein HypE [Syntrophorhabdus sp. PtaU1.Bin002]
MSEEKGGRGVADGGGTASGGAAGGSTGVPEAAVPRITLGHGAGGRLTHALVRDLFAARLGNPLLSPLGDAALCPEPGGRIALTTDSFVVDPLFFPGGDIGSLAVNGTVNDLAVAGARPLWLTLGAILEEGLPLADLERIVDSLAAAARVAGVAIVAGDTKVVERGKGDGAFLNTAGVGVLRDGYPRADRGPAPGDAVLVSGPLGDHGAVIVARRRGLDLQVDLASDCAPVTPLVDALFAAGVAPLFMRDPTRGGLAGVLADLAEMGAAGGGAASAAGAAGSVEMAGGMAGNAAAVAGPGGAASAQPRPFGVHVDEAAVPLRPAVAALGAITGIDPWHLACEGRVVAVVAAADAERALAAWRAAPGGEAAARIGELTAARPGQAVVATPYGGARLLLRPTAELLPRIC